MGRSADLDAEGAAQGRGPGPGIKKGVGSIFLRKIDPTPFLPFFVRELLSNAFQCQEKRKVQCGVFNPLKSPCFATVASGHVGLQ